MIVSVTETGGEYMRCRRRWDLGSRNRQGLTRIVAGDALSLGTLIHAALADWLIHPDLRLKDIFTYRANESVETAKSIYTQQVGARPADSELHSLYEATIMGQAMMENYQEHWRTPLPPGFELVSPEQRVQVPIPGTEHTSEWIYDPETDKVKFVRYEDIRFHYLEGRLDGVIREIEGPKKLYVLEHKTYSSRPSESSLLMNDQFTGYHYMLERLELGSVAGIAYDGLWKRAAPPKKVDNRAGILSDLFIRIKLPRSPLEVTEYEAMLRDKVFEMANNPAIYKNRTWDGSCNWCDYEKLCTAMTLGEDTEYIKRRYFMHKDTVPLALSEDE